MNAVLYIRVSTAEQASEDKPSLQQQEGKCRALCVARDLNVLEVYSDVTSGAKWERPALQRLLSDARHGLFRVVVFLKVDRLGRNLRDLLTIAEQLKSVDVGIAAVHGDFDTSTSTGRAFFHFLGLFAEFERDQINERMTGGRIGKVQSGAYLASIPAYGYRRNETGELEVDPDQAEVIRRLFKWANEGLGLSSMARKLEEEGVLPPPRTAHKRKAMGVDTWHLSTLHKMLTNPRYMGKATYAGQPMTCPAIVSEELFRSVLNALSSRNGRGMLSPGHQAREYLLRGLTYCRECGSTAGGRLDRHASTGWERASYYCLKRQRYGSKVPHVRARWGADDVEGAVVDWLTRLLADPETTLAAAELHLQDAMEARQDSQRAKLRTQAELDGLDTEEQFIITQARKGHISESAMVQQLDQLKAKRAELEAALEVELPESAGRTLGPDDLRAAIECVKLYRDTNLDRYIARRDWMNMVRAELAGELEVRGLVSAVWLESDGGVSVEGVIPTSTPSVEPSVELAERTSPRPYWTPRSLRYSYTASLKVAA